ncbi:PREDICTED: structure-specific endonuclease subunit SLX4-like [Priapulus caudatus]|uniref:Structure-specific endonuclease subunit SLX4 n=1 Tax=Priapulus caudatus TaxID=37621 RepID=A0ABM1EES9_PRICU|nr:PREDICTED: structure-specific endonuclease subunit SLX4-like [Priapulus caudatus]
MSCGSTERRESDEFKEPRDKRTTRHARLRRTKTASKNAARTRESHEPRAKIPTSDGAGEAPQSTPSSDSLCPLKIDDDSVPAGEDADDARSSAETVSGKQDIVEYLQSFRRVKLTARCGEDGESSSDNPDRSAPASSSRHRALDGVDGVLEWSDRDECSHEEQLGCGGRLDSCDSEKLMQSDEEYARAIQYKDSEMLAQTDGIGKDGSYLCQICNKNLAHLSYVRREQHMNRCLDQREQKESQRELLRGKVPDCPLCDRKLKTEAARKQHLKKCALSKNVAVVDLIQICQKQTADFEASKAAGTLQVAPRAAATKSNAALRWAKKLRPTNALDEQIQVHTAMALSVSLMEQDHQQQQQPASWVDRQPSDLVRGGGRDGARKVKQRRKQKREETVPLLLQRSREENLRILDQRVKVLVSQWDDYSDTEARDLLFRASRLPSKYTCTRGSICLEDNQLSEDENVCPLWRLSLLPHCSAWTQKQRDQYYVPCLIPPISPCKVAAGSKLKDVSNIYGRRLSTMPSAKMEPAATNVLSNDDAAELLANLASQSQAPPVVDKTLHQLNSSCAGFLFESDEGDVSSVPREAKVDNNMAARLASMVGNDAASDVTVQSETRRIPAHKFVFAMRSAELWQMVKDIDSLDWRDYTSVTCMCVLKFLYSGSTHDVDHNNASKVLEIANRYGLQSLADACGTQLPAQDEPPDLSAGGAGDGGPAERTDDDDDDDDDLYADLFQFTCTQGIRRGESAGSAVDVSSSDDPSGRCDRGQHRRGAEEVRLREGAGAEEGLSPSTSDVSLPTPDVGRNRPLLPRASEGPLLSPDFGRNRSVSAHASDGSPPSLDPRQNLSVSPHTSDGPLPSPDAGQNRFVSVHASDGSLPSPDARQNPSVSPCRSVKLVYAEYLDGVPIMNRSMSPATSDRTLEDISDSVLDRCMSPGISDVPLPSPNAGRSRSVSPPTSDAPLPSPDLIRNRSVGLSRDRDAMLSGEDSVMIVNPRSVSPSTSEVSLLSPDPRPNPSTNRHASRRGPHSRGSSAARDAVGDRSTRLRACVHSPPSPDAVADQSASPGADDVSLLSPDAAPDRSVSPAACDASPASPEVVCVYGAIPAIAVATPLASDLCATPASSCGSLASPRDRRASPVFGDGSSATQRASPARTRHTTPDLFASSPSPFDCALSPSASDFPVSPHSLSPAESPNPFEPPASPPPFECAMSRPPFEPAPSPSPFERAMSLSPFEPPTSPPFHHVTSPSTSDCAVSPPSFRPAASPSLSDCAESPFPAEPHTSPPPLTSHDPGGGPTQTPRRAGPLVTTASPPRRGFAPPLDTRRGGPTLARSPIDLTDSRSPSPGGGPTSSASSVGSKRKEEEEGETHLPLVSTRSTLEPLSSTDFSRGRWRKRGGEKEEEEEEDSDSVDLLTPPPCDYAGIDEAFVFAEDGASFRQEEEQEEEKEEEPVPPPGRGPGRPTQGEKCGHTGAALIKCSLPRDAGKKLEEAFEPFNTPAAASARRDSIASYIMSDKVTPKADYLQMCTPELDVSLLVSVSGAVVQPETSGVNTEQPSSSQCSSEGVSTSDHKSDSDELPEESILVGVPLSQEGKQTDVAEKVRHYIVSNQCLYERVLMYETLQVSELHQELNSAGIRCSQPRLLDILDSLCVNFTVQRSNQQRCRKGRKRGKARRSPKSSQK